MKKEDPFWITFGIYGAVGIQLAGAVLGGWFLGDFCDARWGSTPYLALSGLVLGFIGGLYNLIRVLHWQQHRKEKNSLDERG